MAILLLIRHGRTQANVDGILAGRTPGVVLDEVGVSRATTLGEELASIDVVRVVASPLERTVQTAELVFAKKDVITDAGLIECDYGQWTGQSISELSTLPLWSTVQKQPSAVTFPEGESMTAMSARAVQAIANHNASVETEFGEHAVWAAFSHGDVIKAICADVVGMNLDDFQKLSVDPTSVCVIHIGKERSQLVKLNDSGKGLAAYLGNLKPKETVGGESGKEQG